MIPISLYVIIEILKLILAGLIWADECMIDEETKRNAECWNSDLIEELGQVEFVFSDKTGTLTQNKMDFKRCSVYGRVFTDDEEKDPYKTWDGVPISSWKQMTQWAVMAGPMISEVQQQLISFFTFMAVCHSVVVDWDPKTPNKLLY